jgi:hypothetical protein
MQQGFLRRLVGRIESPEQYLKKVVNAEIQISSGTQEAIWRRKVGPP